MARHQLLSARGPQAQRLIIVGATTFQFDSNRFVPISNINKDIAL